jgi:ankyrin repeat protein
VNGPQRVAARVERGDCNILKLLIDYGADVSRPDFDTGTTPSDIARSAENNEMIKLLLDAM